MAGKADAPNLVGSSLEQSVIDQLQQRALRLTQAGVRDGSDIRALGNKNCWIRLSSFVNLLPSAVTELKKVVGGEVNIEGGTYLAEQWALKAEQRNGSELKYGVGVGGAYGSGGISELGYRPMPGISSATIESQPPAGAIRTATVKIKAWNINQLSMIDVLYFRLGFSMLLEWGHSIFTDNKGKLINGATPINIFKPGWTKELVLQELAKKRKAYSHNYEGMLGLVTNYEWAQNQDGSYDCTLRLSGIGSIIESLKINTQNGMSDTKPNAAEQAVAQQKVAKAKVEKAQATAAAKASNKSVAAQNALIIQAGKAAATYVPPGAGFPSSPFKGQLYFANDGGYEWDGTGWIKKF